MWPVDDDECGVAGGVSEWLGKLKYCPSANVSTTNPILTDQGSNQGLRGRKPATNRLNYGNAESKSVRFVAVLSNCQCFYILQTDLINKLNSMV
jgi:hypothetical protein